MRTIITVFGVTALVFFALTIGPLFTESAFVQPAWQITAALLVFALPPILAAICPLLTLSAMKRALGAYAIMFALVVVTWLPAMSVHPMPANLSPWPFGLTALGTVPAALAWRAPFAWAYLVGNAAVIAPVRLLAAGSSNVAVGLQDALFTLMFASIFTALAMIAMRNGYALDKVAAVARASAARAATIEARAREQGRLDALVHDEVMTALYYASQDSPDLHESVRQQAARAITQLARVSTEHSVEELIAPDAFVGGIRALALDLSKEIALSVRGERSLPVPAAVNAAFAEATAEALRNSLAYADDGIRSVARSVTVTLSDDDITVIVEDDGVGFEAKNIEPHRLGILVSIRGRLAVETGGSANVESTPGHGVVVTMNWRAK
jgi:signal transduction histidine kinase